MSENKGKYCMLEYAEKDCMLENAEKDCMLVNAETMRKNIVCWKMRKKIVCQKDRKKYRMFEDAENTLCLKMRKQCGKRLYVGECGDNADTMRKQRSHRINAWGPRAGIMCFSFVCL